jgi:hypothetical protein
MMAHEPDEALDQKIKKQAISSPAANSLSLGISTIPRVLQNALAFKIALSGLSVHGIH